MPTASPLGCPDGEWRRLRLKGGRIAGGGDWRQVADSMIIPD
jgi:hypothetical protein